MKVLRFPLTLLVIEAVLLVAAAVLSSRLLDFMGAPDTPLRTLGAAGVALAVGLTYWAGRRWIEGSAFNELALPGGARELGLGLLTGFLLFSAMTGIVWAMGGIRFEGVRGAGQIWAMLAMALVSGTFEEALFRGVLFRHIETMLGSWAALGITSALFGAAHLANPDSSPFAAFAIMLEAGILLGAAYMLTRRLWLAIGIHAAWNFTQGWVFSIPVSGGEAPLGLLITRRDGPDWLTGGGFGLEASVVAMAVATLAGMLMLRRAIQTHGVMLPMWLRQTKL